MENNKLIFGIPKQRERKQEQYPDTPVLTMEKAPEAKGAAYRFSLNKKAVELLNITGGKDKIAFAFDTFAKKLYLAKANELDCEQYIVTKKNSFSNQAAHKYIANFLELNEAMENYFTLSKSDDYFELNLITKEEESESTEPIKKGTEISNETPEGGGWGGEDDDQDPGVNELKKLKEEF